MLKYKFLNLLICTIASKSCLLFKLHILQFSAIVHSKKLLSYTTSVFNPLQVTHLASVFMFCAHDGVHCSKDIIMLELSCSYSGLVPKIC